MRGRLTGAVERHGAELAHLQPCAVGGVDLGGVGEEDGVVAAAGDGAELDGDIEVVVGDVHVVLAGVLLGESGRALDGAGESWVLRAEGRLPDVGELVEDVRDGLLVGPVVHKHDDTVVVEDHLAEGGPLILVHGDVGRGVEVLGKAGVLNGWNEVLDDGQVGVTDEDGEDFEGVLLQPSDNGLELRLPSAGVEEIAGGVAVVEGLVDPVDLALHCRESQYGSRGKLGDGGYAYTCEHHRSAGPQCPIPGCWLHCAEWRRQHCVRTLL